jgi:hypothetical protein
MIETPMLTLRQYLGLGCLFSLLCAPLCQAADAPWTSLFDGKSFAGWHGPDGKAPGKGWTVVDGALHLDGSPGGMLLSDGQYDAFELKWEWKIETNGNNGLKYWVSKVAGKEWLGLEYQMIDDAGHPDGKRGGSHTTASIYDIIAPEANKPLKAPGQWNESLVRVTGDRIEHHLNGVLVCSANLSSELWKTSLAASKFKNKPGFAPGRGHLMLTDHGDKVWYRNIAVRRLGQP